MDQCGDQTCKRSGSHKGGDLPASLPARSIFPQSFVITGEFISIFELIVIIIIIIIICWPTIRLVVAEIKCR